MVRLLFVAALAAFALLWAAASASAAPTWLASTNLSEPGANAEGPRVAVDPQGDAVTVWQRYDGANLIVQAASREAGGSWSAPVDLSAPGQDAREPGIAVDAAGDAVAVWQRYDGTDWTIQAASRKAGGAWSAPVDLSAPGENAYESQVAVDAAGDAIAVWQRHEGTTWIVQAASRKAGGAWSAPVDLTSPGAIGQEAREPEIALDAAGDAVAVWNHSNGIDWIIQAASSSALGAWSAPVELSAPGHSAEHPQVAIAPHGDAVATWERSDGSNEIIQASTREAGGTWSAPANLSSPVQSAYYPQVALDTEGDATAVWQHYDGTNWIAQAASRQAGGTWSVPVDLTAPGQSVGSVNIALDPQGDAIAVWKRYDGTGWIAQAASSSALGAWSAPVDLSTPGEGLETPRVALDADGDAVAVWGHYDGIDEIIQAAGYDAAGPQLRGLAVPAAGTVGQALSFSVSPLDVFSAVGATSWSFGDGATAPGTAATHSYARAGTYTVTVTSTDALGNTSTATRTVTVTAAAASVTLPPPPPPKTALATAAARAKVKGGKALLKLTCPASGSCKGELVLTTRVKATKSHRAKKKSRAKSVRIGTASFDLAAGAHATVPVKLSAKGLAQLKKSGKRGLKATVGGTGIRPGPLVLKSTPPRHRPAHRRR